MSYENFFWAKTSVALFLSFENWTKHCEGSHKSARNWRANHVGIQLQVSNYKKFKLDGCNWTPTWSRDDCVTNGRARSQSRSRFCYRYDYSSHWTTQGPVTNINNKFWDYKSLLRTSFEWKSHKFFLSCNNCREHKFKKKAFKAHIIVQFRYIKILTWLRRLGE